MWINDLIILGKKPCIKSWTSEANHELLEALPMDCGIWSFLKFMIKKKHVFFDKLFMVLLNNFVNDSIWSPITIFFWINNNSFHWCI